MKRTTLFWSTLLLLAMVALSVRGCLGIGSHGKPFATGLGGQPVTVNLDVFTGKFYLTVNGNLYVLGGNTPTQELVKTANAMDPAVSPDGKWVAFVEKYQNYTNLCVVSTSGGPVRVLRSGKGYFYKNSGGFIHNTYDWYAQPAWSQDGSTLLVLSDLEKEDWYQQTGQDAPLLDLQVFSIPFAHPSGTPTEVAYATYGDGGDENPSYRPGHPDQIIYTHYTYDAATGTQQQIQLYMENPDTISQNPGMYYPGSPGGGYDPAIAITPATSTITDPAFSPNGNAIAYIKTDSKTNQMELDVMPVPPDRVTQTPNDAATEELALEAYERQSSHLLTGRYISDPVWSPDGKQIAYYTDTNDAFDLWIVQVSYTGKTGTYRLQGSPVQVTSRGVDAASHPVWAK